MIISMLILLSILQVKSDLQLTRFNKHFRFHYYANTKHNVRSNKYHSHINYYKTNNSTDQQNIISK